MIDTPQIVQWDRQLTAAVHLTIPRNDIQQAFGTAVAELLGVLGAQGQAPAGPLLSYHVNMPSEVFDFDIAFPVAQQIQPSGRVVGSEVPAFKVARAVYRGPMEGLGSAWGELREWIGANGHAAQHQMFERYLVGPGDTPDPAQWQTELNWPLED